MQALNLPHHVIKAFEKRWARKLPQQVANWRTTSSLQRTRTDAGVPVERRPCRPRPMKITFSGTRQMPALRYSLRKQCPFCGNALKRATDEIGEGASGMSVRNARTRTR